MTWWIKVREPKVEHSFTKLVGLYGGTMCSKVWTLVTHKHRPVSVTEKTGRWRMYGCVRTFYHVNYSGYYFSLCLCLSLSHKHSDTHTHTLFARQHSEDFWDRVVCLIIGVSELELKLTDHCRLLYKRNRARKGWACCNTICDSNTVSVCHLNDKPCKKNYN